MKDTTKKRIKAASTATLAAALLVTGSLAWQDISQHKTNKFSTKSVAHSMVLVEDFEQVEGWTLGQDIRKEISVRNGQESDDTTRYAYNDGYVRLQIREFMGIASQTYVMSEDRLMIDTSGDFLRFETKTDADAKVSELGLEGDRVVELQGINDDKKYFYIKTQADDSNGQYGKFLVMDIETGDLKSIVDDAVNTDLDKDASDKHNNTDKDTPNLEDTSTYTTHIWSENDDTFTPDSNVFKEYVKWTLGQDVITLQQWKDNYNSKPIAKWIVDTTDLSNGYVYWGQRLDHATHANALSTTTKLLESVQLIKQPKGHAEYRIHVNMDAVSFDDLGLWTDGNQEIINSYKESTELQDLLRELENAIHRGENANTSGMTAESKQMLNDAIQLGKDILAEGGPTEDIIKRAIKNIDQAIASLIVDSRAMLEDLLNIAKSDPNFKDKYLVSVDKWDELLFAVEQAEIVLNSIDTSDEMYESTHKSLENAYNSFKDGKGIGVIGDKVYAFDRTFTFVKHNARSREALIISDSLSYSDYQAMGKSDLVDSDGKLPYYQSATSSSLYEGYQTSNVRQIDEAFYQSFVSAHPHDKYVKKVNIGQESFDPDKWETRDDMPTRVNDVNGVKTSFSLTVSDINASLDGEMSLIHLNAGTSTDWLRSPGRVVTTAAGFTSHGGIRHNSLNKIFGVRPALWVQIP